MINLHKFDMVDFLDSKETRKEYLNQVLEDGDSEELKRALFYISKSEGIEKVAKKSNLSEDKLYKIFRPNSKLNAESLLKIIKALDIKISCS